MSPAIHVSEPQENEGMDPGNAEELAKAKDLLDMLFFLYLHRVTD